MEWTNTSLSTPVRQLAAFDRISTSTSVETQVTLTFPTTTLNVWDDEDGYTLLTGKTSGQVNGDVLTDCSPGDDERGVNMTPTDVLLNRSN